MVYYFDSFGHVYVHIDNIYYLICIDDNELSLLDIYKFSHESIKINTYPISLNTKSKHSLLYDNQYFFNDNSWNIDKSNYEHDQDISSFTILLHNTLQLNHLEYTLCPDNIYDTYLLSQINDNYVPVNIIKSFNDLSYKVILFDDSNDIILVFENNIYKNFKLDIKNKQIINIFNFKKDI